MAPGSVFLGNAGDCFHCSHEHGTGDRCVSFSYAPEVFERLIAETGAGIRFRIARLPPIRALAPIVAPAFALLKWANASTCEELSVRVAAQAALVACGIEATRADADASSLARVTRVLRMIEHEPDVPHDLNSLARIARLSPYHFLRIFEGLTGATPYQYLLRMRLRQAAVRLRTESGRILDIAYDSGFGDISNFNRTFRAEFRVSPRVYRSQV
jgi:transcriptional regulator GlxA family with amidase domain